MSEWIPTKDRLPECGVRVWVTDKDGDVFPILSNNVDGRHVAWMPLAYPAPYVPPVQYRDVDIKLDWGKECEFSDDGKHWFTYRLCGMRPQRQWPFMSDSDSFKFARIKVD